jgi:hypothetical protein
MVGALWQKHALRFCHISGHDAPGSGSPSREKARAGPNAGYKSAKHWPESELDLERALAHAGRPNTAQNDGNAAQKDNFTKNGENKLE